MEHRLYALPDLAGRGYTGRTAPSDPWSAKTGNFLKIHAGAYSVSKQNEAWMHPAKPGAAGTYESEKGRNG